MTLTTPTDLHPLPARAPAPRPRAPRVLALCTFAALLVLALDLGTKHWALSTLSDARRGAAPALCDDASGPRAPQRVPRAAVPIAGEIFSFEYTENCSAAFGLASQLPSSARRVFLASMAVLAVVALFVLLARGHGSAAFAWGVPLVAAGALGNMIDRVRLGYVVDFLHVQYRPWDFDYPVFNVADIAIGVGVSLLVIGAASAPEPTRSPDAGARLDEP